jgi:hypothetical protein
MNNSYIERPKLFAKPVILAFSILLSTFFGAILFAQNLKEIGRKNEILKVILFAIIWNLLVLRTSGRLVTNPILSYVITNILGGAILIFPYWTYYFKEIKDYEKRKIWGPLIVVLAIAGAFTALVLLKK